LAGNVNNERKIVFTQEFKSWLNGAVINHFGVGNVPKNVAKIAELFQQDANVEFHLEKSKSQLL